MQKSAGLIAAQAYVRLSAAPESSPAAAAFSVLDAALTPYQREVIRMYYIGRLSQEEITEKLGKTISSVRDVLKEGRKRLAKALEDI